MCLFYVDTNGLGETIKKAYRLSVRHNMSKKIWFDIVNSSQAQFFRPFVEEFRDGNELIITTRDLSETNNLVGEYGLGYRCFGGHLGTNKALKIWGHLWRTLMMTGYVRGFDHVFSHGSVSPIALKKIYRGELISFFDNEHSDSFGMLGKHSDHFFVPHVLEKDARAVLGIKTRLKTYPGVKEQIYMADFVPDRNKISSIPFEQYVVVRPEAWKSDYVDNKSILAYDLTNALVEAGYNVVFLPRYGDHPPWMDGEERVFVPGKALDGKQLCWFSRGVLTGSGTLAREAGTMGVPSVSFYPSKPLKVDLWMNEQGHIHRSRDLTDILEYLEDGKKRKGLMGTARDVRDHILRHVHEMI